MKIVPVLSILLAALAGLGSPSASQGAVDMATVEKLMDSAREIEAPVFSPKAFAQAQEQFSQARQAIRLQRVEAEADKYLAKTREFVENAIKNTDVCKLTLKEYPPPRDKARSAKAPLLVPALYNEAKAVNRTRPCRTEPA